MISVVPSAVTRTFRFSVVPEEAASGHQVRPPLASEKRSCGGALRSSKVAGVAELTTRRNESGQEPVWMSMERSRTPSWFASAMLIVAAVAERDADEVDARVGAGEEARDVGRIAGGVVDDAAVGDRAAVRHDGVDGVVVLRVGVEERRDAGVVLRLRSGGVRNLFRCGDAAVGAHEVPLNRRRAVGIDAEVEARIGGGGRTAEDDDVAGVGDAGLIDGGDVLAELAGRGLVERARADGQLLREGAVERDLDRAGGGGASEAAGDDVGDGDGGARRDGDGRGAGAPRTSWKVSVAVMGLALRLWSVSSVCQWLSFAPGPVPEAGMTSVVAPAASGRSVAKIAARMRLIFISGFSFVVLRGDTRARKRVSRNLCDHSM